MTIGRINQVTVDGGQRRQGNGYACRVGSDGCGQ